MTLVVVESSVRPGHLALAGALDLAAAQMMRDRVTAILRAPAVTEVVIDLAAVDFLDAAGVGALVAGYHEAVRTGRTLSVTAARGLPRRILDLTGVMDLLTSTIRQG